MTAQRQDLGNLTAQEKRALLEQLLRRRAHGRPDTFSLSLGQQALWFLHQVAPQSAAYNVVLASRLQGSVNLTAFQCAVKGVVERHAMLRAKFTMTDSGPAQTIRATLDLPMDPIDATGWTDEEVWARLLEESRLPFRLEECVVRVALFERPADEFVFLFVAHHIAFDAWSLGVILKELQASYVAISSGRQPDLPRLEAEYWDFVEWQARNASGTEGEAAWNAWKNRLSGELPLLEIPTDHPRPAAVSFRGASFDFTLRAPLAIGVRRLAQAHDQTTFSVLLTAFGVLLHRYSGQTGLLIGVPTSGRSRAEFESLVGYLVNPVVIRLNAEGDPGFHEFVSQAGAVVRDALRYADFPFPVIVQRLQPVRDTSRSPLFQVMFNYFRLGQLGLDEQVPDAVRKETRLVLEPIHLPQQEGQFDLSLDVGETSDALSCTLKYNTDLFDRSTIERMARHYEQVLACVVADPTRRLSEIPLLTANEQAQITTWNATAASYPREAGLLGLLAAQVERQPEAVAVRQGTRALTYAALDAAATRLADYLRSLEVGPDVPVGVCLDRTPDMLVALLGVLKAGGAYVPLDPGFPPARLAFMVENAGAQVVLTQTAHAGLIPPGVPHVVCLDRDRDRIATAPARAAGHLPAPDDLAYVIYTSGSTGQPKGVEIAHGALVNLLTTMAREPGFTAADTLLAVTTLSFDIAALELFLPLICGGTVVVATREEAGDPQALLTLLGTTGATVMQATPATWRMLLEAGWEGTPGLKILCGGEALPRDLANSLLARAGEVWNVYGPTETTIWSAAWKAEAGDGPVPIGRPIGNTQMYVVDRRGNPQPIGVIGELFIGGDGLARGYRDRPDLTAERFVPDPFSTVPGARLYRTGDLARWRPDGTIECLGRMDHQVKVRGFRIELGEIEAALARHPGVRQAAVAARVYGPTDTRLVAYVVGEAGLSTDGLQAHLQGMLPEYMVPALYVFLDALPLTPNGKVDRTALAASDRTLGQPRTVRGATQQEFEPPDGTTEVQLAKIWEDMLGCGSIGAHDNFFDLGGHSLLAMRMLSRVEQVFGQRVPVKELFARGTIRDLAGALLEQNRENFHRLLMPIKTGGAHAPFFFLHGDYKGGGFYSVDLARRIAPEQPFYVLHPLGLDGAPVPPTIEGMAEEYLKVLRASWPNGPYLLGGYCNGGLVAFEMARRIQACGEQVGFLLAIDTWLWNVRLRGLESVSRLVGKAFGLAVGDQKQLYIRMQMAVLTVEYLLRFCRRQPREALQKVWRRLRGTRTIPAPRSGIDAVYRRAIVNYVPKRFPGQVTLILSSAGKAEHYDRAWHRVVKDLEVYVVPGDHTTAITRHVHIIAERLKECLEVVQRQRTNATRP